MAVGLSPELASIRGEIKAIKEILSRITDGRRVTLSQVAGALPSGALPNPRVSDPLEVTAGAGLSVNYTAGRVRVQGTVYAIAAGNLAGLTNATTNYVFVNSSGAIAFNTTGFPTTSVPLATVVTAGGVVTTVTDKRATLEDDGVLIRVRKNSAGSTFVRPRLNLIEGGGVTLTVADDSVDEEIDVTVVSSGSAHTIQEDGTPLTQRPNLNFRTNLIATDDAGNNATVVDLTTNIVMADDAWIGLGAGAGRIVFDITPTPDVVAVMDARLGVGTVAPDTFLHLKAANPEITIEETGDAIKGYLSLVSSVSVDFLMLSNNRRPSDGTKSNVNRPHAGINVVTATGDSYIQFFTGATNNADGTERLRIIKSGSVGIGVTAPDTFVHLKAANPEITIEETGDAIKGYLSVISSSGTDYVILSNNRRPSDGTKSNVNRPHASINIVTATGNGYIQFFTGATNNADGTERMRIDKDGNVLIGAYSAPTRLFTLQAAANAYQSWMEGTTVRMTFGYEGSTNDRLVWYDDSGGAYRMTLTRAGDLRIGTQTNPTDGNSRLRTNGPTSGFMVWEYDGLDGTHRVVIPDGTGDVLYRLGGGFVVRASDGTSQGATLWGSGAPMTPGGGTTNIFSSGGGTNVAVIEVLANGQVEVYRTAGTLTYKVALLLHWH